MIIKEKMITKFKNKNEIIKIIIKKKKKYLLILNKKEMNL